MKYTYTKSTKDRKKVDTMTPPVAEALPTFRAKVRRRPIETKLPAANDSCWDGLFAWGDEVQQQANFTEEDHKRILAKVRRVRDEDRS